MHVPRISERDDTLLHQIPQILDRRAGATAVPRTRSNGTRTHRREERRRGIRVHALGIPLARGGGSRCCCGRRNCGGGAGCRDRTWLLQLLLLDVEDAEGKEEWRRRARCVGRRHGTR